jgi:hypothetical protein
VLFCSIKPHNLPSNIASVHLFPSFLSKSDQKAGRRKQAHSPTGCALSIGCTLMNAPQPYSYHSSVPSDCAFIIFSSHLFSIHFLSDRLLPYALSSPIPNHRHLPIPAKQSHSISHFFHPSSAGQQQAKKGQGHHGGMVGSGRTAAAAEQKSAGSCRRRGGGCAFLPSILPYHSFRLLLSHLIRHLGRHIL